MTGLPVRMVVLDHSARLSGAEINLTKVLPNLPGFTTTVVLGEQGDLVRALADRGVDTRVLPLERSAAQIAAQQRGVRALLRGGFVFAAYSLRLVARIRRLRPDLIYTNSSKAHLYGAVVATLLRVPLVCHVHDRLTADTYSSPSLRALQFVYGRRAAGLIANSRSTAATLPVSARSRTVSLPCPVEPAGPVGRAPSDVIRFAVIGRISPWKGQDLAVRAFAAWLGRSPVGGRLEIVGGALFGEDDYVEQLDRTIDRLDLRADVARAGHVTPERIHDVLVDCDVLLHTSLIPEPFGQVVIEGMQAGLVVIAADAGGPAEIVTDGVDGLLYPMGDEEALVAAMTEAAGSAELRARIGAAAAVAAQAYDIPAVVPRYGNFLEKTARRGR